MSERRGQDRLLGLLLERGIIQGQLEVIATRAVGVLLEDGAVADCFTTWLGERYGVKLPDQLAYRTESGVAGGGRVDVAGSAGTSLQVAVEAKFGAALGVEQLLAYARALEGPLLAVLVPAHRRDEALAVLASAEGELAAEGVTGVTLTWDELTDALETAGAHAGDVEQLRSLCAAAGGLDIGHFTLDELQQGRHARLDDLHALCDRVTSRLHLELVGGRVYPLQPPDGDFTGFRFVCPQRGAYCFAIGVRPWESAPEAPIWMRWHRHTGDITAEEIHSRLRNAGVRSSRDDNAHVWAALELQPTTDAPTMIDQLATQALHLDAIARDLPGPPES